MPRYFTTRAKPKASDEYWEPESLFLPGLLVPDHVPADTGLIDRRGDAIMRAPNPMGFVWD